ncbi:MAG: alginate export family protein, partial [Proteobacteria bacterium]|nr:alginate export family protein [Pseudomonadota bacterium]
MKKSQWVLCASIAGLLALAPGSGVSSAMEDLTRMVREGQTTFDFRYRYENVDQDGFKEDADASTLRSRLTYTSADLNNFSFLVEADYVSVIGSERYNSTVNGKTQYPTVTDPDGFDLNQALIRFKTDGVTATLGRQRILHGSQRFVGGVGWRQNEQTYDGLRGEFSFGKRVHLDYSYVGNVNRVFGPDDGVQPGDWKSDTHLLRGTFDLHEKHKIVAVAYLMDFDNDNGPLNSNATYGLDYMGEIGPVGLKASVAQQTDYGESPLNYDATYYLIEAKLSLPVVL